MKIQLNGKEHQVQGPHNLKILIDQFLKDPSRSLIAEVNGEIIKTPQWEQTLLKDGDSIELVSFVGGGSQTAQDPLIIAGKSFASRFLLGTGKFKNKIDLKNSILEAGIEIVTVALRRIDLERHDENILEYIPKNVTLLVNTSGARNAKEALRIAQLSRESGYGNWIKVEVINDSKYLLPDNAETIKATEMLVKEGFIALPYMSPDLYVARELVKAGAATIMPLGSLIGSNQGLKVKELIKIIIQEIEEVPIVVDAGIGLPSHAAEAMEMGAAAVLANTAIASAENPPMLAKAFNFAIQAGRLAYLSKTAGPRDFADPSSPLTGFLYETN